MLSYNQALEMYEKINSSDFNELKQQLFKSAIRYAHIRAEWHFKNLNEQIPMMNALQLITAL